MSSIARSYRQKGATELAELVATPGVTVSTVVDADAAQGGAEDSGLPYHRLGLYLAKTAHVLIALWDGAMEKKPGGTLDVLASFLDRDFDPEPSEALPEPIEISDIPIDLPGPAAVWVRSPRLGSNEPAQGGNASALYVVGSGPLVCGMAAPRCQRHFPRCLRTWGR